MSDKKPVTMDDITNTTNPGDLHAYKFRLQIQRDKEKDERCKDINEKYDQLDTAIQLRCERLCGHKFRYWKPDILNTGEWHFCQHCGKNKHVIHDYCLTETKVED